MPRPGLRKAGLDPGPKERNKEGTMSRTLLHRVRPVLLAFPLLVVCGLPAAAQGPATTPPQPTPAAVAATVNGQPIYESVVMRALEPVPQAKRAEARPELMDFLIDNMLIDQHLLQLKIAVEKAEIDKRMAEMDAALQKEKKSLAEVMQKLKLSEAELREQVAADLRWDKFCTAQATDKVLQEFFEKNKEMFDGTTVRARHILLTPPSNEGQAAEATAAMLRGFKKQIEGQAAEGLTKLPANADALAKEKARLTLIDDAFASVAKEKSTCPSKAKGGDVGFFGRGGFMVEPFARAAFALKPGEMSDVVKTQFGFHLILCVERKPGMAEVKFDAIKEGVKDVYCERLREGLAVQLRGKAKIEITQAPKP
jgi:peptidyl-prolyl cis-trans isomerase C